MARRKGCIREKQDRWLVSYADFITLLFAFFVVLFTASHVNRTRVQQIARSYSAYLRGDPVLLIPVRLQNEATDAETARNILTVGELMPVKKKLHKKLAPMLDEGEISLSLTPRGLVLSLREAAFFPVGKASFRVGAEELLAHIGQAMRDIPDQPIRLEGHTDNVPIHNDEFESNWELSSWRAIEVMHLLTERFGIAPERISVVGYGDLRPVADNRRPEGRAKNRRVDIVILSRSAAQMAPRQRLKRP